MLFLFHNWYVMLVFFFRNMKNSVQRIYSGFKVIEAGIFFTETSLKQGHSSRKLQTTFRKLYGRHTYLVHQFDTSVSHMLKGLFTNCDTWSCFVILCKSWRVSHVGQDMLTLSWTPDFTSFGEFMISPIHYIYIAEFVSSWTMFTD